MLSPQNTAGVSGVNSVAANSSEIDLNGTISSDVNKTTQKNIKCLHAARVVSSKCPQAPTFIFSSEERSCSHRHNGKPHTLSAKGTSGVHVLVDTSARIVTSSSGLLGEKTWCK